MVDKRELFEEILEERISMLLSEQSEETQKRNRITADLIDQFANSLEPDRKRQFEELIDRIMAENGEESRYLYLNGVYDGARVFRLLLKI